MQKTERVGAVALLFLIVTIVAVALWDDGASGEAVASTAHGEDATAQQQATAQRQRPQQQAQQQQQQQAQRRQQRAQQQAQQQARAERDRHDGLRVTRAADRGGSQNLLAGAGEVAPVRARGAQDPVLSVQPAVTQEQAPAAVETTLDPALQANGWNNGRQPRAEQSVVVEAAAPVQPQPQPQRPRESRKRKADPVVASAAAPAASGRTHVVRRGESLGLIAQRRLGRASRWPEIAMLNGIQDERIAEGQTLRLPGDAVASATPTPSVQPGVLPTARVASRPAPASSGSRTYTIRKGDVLGLIAQRELGSSKRWKEILSLNPGLDEKKLHVGKTILLPTTGATPAPRRSLVAANTDPAFRVR